MVYVEKIATRIVDAKDVEQAGKILREGGVVAFPTETVYGLGANALDEQAVNKIYLAKGRPSDNPLIVHIARQQELNSLVSEIPQVAKVLMEKFWPGPLTLIMPRSELVPNQVTGGLTTVAVRMPNHPVALAVIEAAGVPIAAPSANLSGKPSPTSAEHVIQDLNGRVEMIIDGGQVGLGVESTVLDLTVTPPAILRPGGVTEEMLLEYIGKVNSPYISETKEKPKSPGMKYTHYSPDADVYLVTGTNISKIEDKIQSLAAKLIEEGIRVGYLISEELSNSFSHQENVIISGSRKNINTVAKNIYHALRKFDQMGVEAVIVEGYEESGLGKAVMNRLKKAAGERVF